MKFIVSSHNLLKQLQPIAGVIKSKNVLPILNNFLFDIEDKKLKVHASDLETSVICKLDVEADETGKIAIPAQSLLDLLKTFPDIPLTFIISDETNEIQITSEEGKYKLQGYNGEDFPQFPELPNPSFFEINAKSLYKAITKTVFAVSKDEGRAVLTGVYFQLFPDNTTFAATDAHKLVKYVRTDVVTTKVTTKRGESDSSASINFIVPAKPLNILKNILSALKDEEKIRVEYNNTNALFSSQQLGIKIITKLIEGKYPNYESVIPNDNPNILTIDRFALLTSLKRLIQFANKINYQVKFKIGGNELNILSEDNDAGTEGKERLSCQYEGEDMTIGFNGDFLSEILSIFESEHITIKMAGQTRAGVIFPAEKEDKEEDIIVLLMPIQV